MNRLFTSALSVLSVVTIVSPSFASDVVTSKANSTKFDRLRPQKVTMNKKVTHTLKVDSVNPKKISTKFDYLNQKRIAANNLPSSVTNQTSPVNLVQIAYQGFLKDNGVPSGASFFTSVNRGDITPESLVQSAIDNGRLAPQTLNDKAYLNIVESELDGLNVN